MIALGKTNKQALYLHQNVAPLDRRQSYCSTHWFATSERDEASENRDLYQGDLLHMEFADETKMFCSVMLKSPGSPRGGSFGRFSQIVIYHGATSPAFMATTLGL